MLNFSPKIRLGMLIILQISCFLVRNRCIKTLISVVEGGGGALNPKQLQFIK